MRDQNGSWVLTKSTHLQAILDMAHRVRQQTEGMQERSGID